MCAIRNTILNNTLCEKAARAINIICDIVAWPTNAECSCFKPQTERKKFFWCWWCSKFRNSGHTELLKKF